MFRFLLTVSVMAIAVVAVVFALRPYVLDAKQFPVAKVRVTGDLVLVDSEHLQELVQPYLTRGFFGVRTRALRDEILATPWVQQVGVHRVWPNILEIELAENTYVARWNEQEVLTEDGVLVPLPKSENLSVTARKALRKHLADLPQVYSVTADDPKLLWDKIAYAENSLRPFGISVARVHEDHRHALAMVLDNGIELRLGQRDFYRRIDQLTASYVDHVAPHVGRISYADLRYNNGFSLG